MRLLKKRKAQTEVLGVAIIVIMLVIGGVIMIRARLNKADETQLDSYEDPELAQSFLNVMMKTKTDINLIVQDIIQECYADRMDICRTGNTADCCDYAYLVMKNSLQETLGEWSKNYQLTVRKGGETKGKIQDISVNCDENSEQGQPGTYGIPFSPSTIIVTLRICKD
ncbi:hypothetical protein JXC34_01965 [Candidatus Woesearchaeota archaeon]|nr:hypothetical protein [Candidatus Woesearchaeota archaeon]